MHRRDAIGDRIHLGLALLGAAALAGPVTMTEIAFAPLLVFSLVRVLNAGPTWIHWLGQPVMLGTLALAVWQGVGLWWSGDRVLGLDQMASLRWVLLGLLIWPVIERRRWIIYALAAGLLAGNLAQAGHAVGRAWDIEWLTWPRYRHRNSAWWHPVVGGTMLTAALGLHLPAALMGRGRARWVAMVLAGVTLLGVVATGSRGAWLASAGLVVISVGVAVATRGLRGPRGAGSGGPGSSGPDSGRTGVPGVVGGAAVVLLVGAVMWWGLGETVTKRAAKAQKEVTAALAGDTASDTGRRIEMLVWAWRAAAARPVTGVGTGGYRAWVEARDEDAVVFDHAHNAPMHLLASNGLVGLGLGAFVIAAGLRGGMRGLGGASLGTYDAGPVFAIVGLLLVSAFDAVHINAQTAAMLGLLLGLCPCWRPAEEPRA